MSEIDSTSATPLPEPPSKRRRVDGESAGSTPRHSTPDERDADRKLSISIRERSARRSRSRSRTSPPSDDDYYSEDATPRTRSPDSARSRSRSRSSRSASESVSHYQSPRSRSASHYAKTSRSVSPSATPAVRKPPILPNYRPALVLGGHKKPISMVRISPNCQYIASASADGTVRVWSATTGIHQHTLIGHMAGVSAIAWSPDSRTLASGSDDKAIRLWDRVTGRPTRSKPLLGHHNYVYSLAFSPKGNILASGSYDEAVFLWDVRAGRLMRSLPAHSDPVSGIGFCRDGTLVVSCSTDGLTRIWDASTGQCLRTLVHEDNPPITSVCFSPNGRYVLAFSLDSCIRLWDYVSGTVKKTYSGHLNKGFSIGGCFATLHRNKPLTITTNGDIQSQNDIVDSDADSAAFIVAPSEDGDIVLWDVKSKNIVQRLESAHDGVTFWVDASSDGEALVSVGQDGRIKVFRHKREEDEVVDLTNDNKTVAGDSSASKESTAQQNGGEETSVVMNGVTDQEGPETEPPLEASGVKMEQQ